MRVEDTGVIDKEGRIYLKENIRRVSKLNPGTPVMIVAEEGKIMILKKPSVADKYRGCFKVKKEFKELLRDVDEAIKLFSRKEAMGELK